MKKEDSQAEQIGDLIKRLMEENDLSDSMDEQQILYHWMDVVGASINRYTVQRYIKDHVLYVHLTSAPLRHELAMHKTRLLKALNEITGKQTITDIIFR